METKNLYYLDRCTKAQHLYLDVYNVYFSGKMEGNELFLFW